MKHFLLVFLVVFLISCTKEKDTIAEKHSDDYTIEWMKIDYDSIKGSDKNYELIELFIPKDKNKDTLFDQIKFYSNGKLNIKYSKYYDLEVSATEKKHVYKAKIKMYSGQNEYRDKVSDIYFLNFYKDSTSLEEMKFGDVDYFEIEFINYHNNRFSGTLTEYVTMDTIIAEEKEDMVTLRTIETVLSNKRNMSGIFIENGSLTHQRKFSLKDYRKIN